MQETIRKLLVLQKYDLEILDLDRREKELRDRVATEQREFDEQIAELEAERDRLMHLQVALKELELELDSRQEKKHKLEEQQSAIKRNPEYKAMMKEILDVQAAIQLNEDKILEKYEEIDQEKREAVARDKAVAEHNAQLKQRVAEVEGELQRIAEQFAGAQARRQQAEGHVESSALRLYQRIFEKKGGAAVVPIVSRSCGGCHLAVTAQTENLARRLEQLVQCENCSRILYVSEEKEQPGEAASDAPA